MGGLGRSSPLTVESIVSDTRNLSAVTLNPLFERRIGQDSYEPHHDLHPETITSRKAKQEQATTLMLNASFEEKESKTRLPPSS